MPLLDDVGCIDLDERKIISDETVRELLLGNNGARNITDFQSLDKQRQKDIVLDVMNKLEAGLRQISRVSV